MGNLVDLLLKPLNELSDEELETRINLLRRTKIGGRPRAKTTNKERRLKNLISQLNKQQLKLLVEKLEEMQK